MRKTFFIYNLFFLSASVFIWSWGSGEVTEKAYYLIVLGFLWLSALIEKIIEVADTEKTLKEIEKDIP